MRLFAASLVLFSISQSAWAETVYLESFASWTVEGLHDQNDADNNVCIISNFNRDSTNIKINVFPKSDGSQNVTMSITHPEWDLLVTDEIQEADFYFISSKYKQKNLVGYVNVLSPTRVIFRRMNGNFSKSFIHYDRMVVFPDEDEETIVELKGTTGIASNLDTCISKVLKGY